MNRAIIPSSAVAQEFARGGDFLDMLDAELTLTHACAVRMEWITAASCHETILSASDLSVCRACQHGQSLANTFPGGARVALPPVSSLPDLGAVGAAFSRSVPSARLCGEKQLDAAPTTGPGPRTAVSSAAGGPGATGATECEKSPRIRSERLGLVRVSPKAKKCSQEDSPLEAGAYASKEPRAKLDPEEKRRRKLERSRKYRALAAARRKEERELAQAKLLEAERREAKRQAVAQAKREHRAKEREKIRRLRILAETLAYLIPRHGGTGRMGLRFTRLIMADRSRVDLPINEFRDLCETAGLTIVGRSGAVMSITINHEALAFTGLEKEAA